MARKVDKVDDESSQPPLNEISPLTGKLDARFALWRVFCAENAIAVESLPSELQGEAKERWENFKEERLHKPVEDRT